MFTFLHLAIAFTVGLVIGAVAMFRPAQRRAGASEGDA